MPNGIEELNYKFWTSLTRQGCAGEIRNCFSNRTDLYERNSSNCGSTFWSTFDRTDTGACVALQTVPFGMGQEFKDEYLTRYSLGPVFAACRELNYFACEVEGPKSQHLADEKIQVRQMLNKQ